MACGVGRLNHVRPRAPATSPRVQLASFFLSIQHLCLPSILRLSRLSRLSKGIKWGFIFFLPFISSRYLGLDERCSRSSAPIP